MAVNNSDYLKQFHQIGQAAGAKAINSDFSFEIEGFEAYWFLAKQCPWPTVSSGGEIEVPGPLGSVTWQQQQNKTHQQGAISFMETVAGSIDTLMTNVIAQGGYFNAKVYEGSPQKFLRAKRLIDCFFVLDPIDRDTENRAQILTFTGSLFYHYYGEILPGNSNVL